MEKQRSPAAGYDEASECCSACRRDGTETSETLEKHQPRLRPCQSNTTARMQAEQAGGAGE
jgi:hypothetical protein